MDGPVRTVASANVAGSSASRDDAAAGADGASARTGSQRDAAHAAGQNARPAFLAAGNPRPVLRAATDAFARGESPVLALVLETEGSTYARVGTLALFAGDAQVGWLSGGCLEPELARRAAQVAETGRIGWIEIDTRDDGALFSGAALGCRGRLRIALLPLVALPHAQPCLARWLDGGAALEFVLESDGRIAFVLDGVAHDAPLACDAPEWTAAACRWNLPLPRMPEALLLGAGPETPVLVGLLRDLGWRVSAAESRERWQAACVAADALAGSEAERQQAVAHTDVALVMHHDFERDLAALDALARTHVPFIGLLGPPRRRDDLLKLLDPAVRTALRPRLHAPVGLNLGGQGPEAIALSIAAQLQAWRANHAAAADA
jgi:xanthine dehydrogenase accessory factor